MSDDVVTWRERLGVVCLIASMVWLWGGLLVSVGFSVYRWGQRHGLNWWFLTLAVAVIAGLFWFAAMMSGRTP